MILTAWSDVEILYALELSDHGRSFTKIGRAISIRFGTGRSKRAVAGSIKRVHDELRASEAA